MINLFGILIAAACAASAAPNLDGLPVDFSTSAVVPTILTLAPNVHDYTRFADGGPDANWYVGSNNAWIVKLPPAPDGDFRHAFIGAKIGRAKSKPNESRPWLRELIPGKVYMGISKTPAWTAEQSFFLTETRDIPTEVDPTANVENTGAAEWFWAEVPRRMVSSTGPNYLILWSPTQYFVSASSSPILAAATDETSGRPTSAWNNHSLHGVPPRNSAAALETPLNHLLPAIAIKLVPPGPDESSVAVYDISLAHSGHHALVRFAADGQDISEAWVESSRDRLDWERVSKLQRRPPFTFNMGETAIYPGMYVRGAAQDSSGEIGYSDPLMIPFSAQADQ